MFTFYMTGAQRCIYMTGAQMCIYMTGAQKCIYMTGAQKCIYQSNWTARYGSAPLCLQKYRWRIQRERCENKSTLPVFIDTNWTQANWPFFTIRGHPADEEQLLVSCFRCVVTAAVGETSDRAERREELLLRETKWSSGGSEATSLMTPTGGKQRPACWTYQVVMRYRTTFRSTTDRIYDGGGIRL